MTSESSLFRVFLDDRVIPKVSRADGCHIYTEGQRFLDTTGGGTSYAIIGWNNSEVNDAIVEQLGKFGHMDYKIWDDPNTQALANLVISKAPKGLSRLYFAGNSGAEACEAAMKMSYQTHQIAGKPKKKWFISRKQSYHGSTADALALGERPNLEFYRQMLSPYRRHVEMHHFKKMSKPGESESEYASRCASELEQLICEIGADQVAGFVGETIMGGLIGDVPPVGDYWKKISEVCKYYNVHLLIDEVYCGTGTTGTYFSLEQDGIIPDFVFMGKTLAAGYGAISAVATTQQIHETIQASSDKRLQHTTTHQAHSLSLAAALQVQKIVSQESFLTEVKRKGDLFRKLLSEGLKQFPQVIDIRGRGLRFSVEHNIKDQINFGGRFEEMTKNRFGVLVNAKWHRVCFTPPLTISDEEIKVATNATVLTFGELVKKFT